MSKKINIVWLITLTLFETCIVGYTTYSFITFPANDPTASSFLILGMFILIMMIMHINTAFPDGFSND